MNNDLKNDVSYLKLNKKIINILHENNINTIEDLWCKTKINLKSINLTDTQIKEIIIKLELMGLDLNKKKNK